MRTDELQASIEAGRAAFWGIAGSLSDHLHHGKGMPMRPRCPYRLPEKVEAWAAGYREAHDEFMRESFDSD